MTWPSGMTRPGAAGDLAGPGPPAAAVTNDPAAARRDAADGRARISTPSGRCAADDGNSDRGSGPCWPAAPARRVPRAITRSSRI